MRRVQLSEVELRKVIRTALLEQDPGPAASTPTSSSEINFYDDLDVSSLADGGKAVQYLIDAYGQFSSDDALTVSAGGELPTPDKSIQKIKAYLDKNPKGLYTVQSLAWDTMSPQDKQMNATAIVAAYLKIKIIEALNDEQNKTNPRDVFFIDGQMYRKDALPASPGLTQTIDQLKKLTNVSQDTEFSSKAFFDKLDDPEFVKNISDPATGYDPTDGGPFASVKEFPGVFYISVQMAEAVKKALHADARKQIAGIKDLLGQFDTDFVETFFCTPLVYPDTWKRYCYDSAHPVSTPWKQSYIIANIASNAASIPGGLHALYHKLMQFYMSGPKVQMSESPTMSKDPYAVTGMFQGAALNESRKVLVTLDELKRIISAALHENTVLEAAPVPPAAAADAGPGFWSKAGEFITAPFRNRPKAEDIEGAASTLTIKGQKVAKGSGVSVYGGVYEDVFKSLTDSAVEEIRNIALALSRSLRDTAPGVKSSAMIQLQSYYSDAASRLSGARNETIKSDLAQLLSTFAEMRANGKTFDEIIIALTEETVTGGGLERIRNMAPAKREMLLRLLGDLKDDGSLMGEAAVTALKGDTRVAAAAEAVLQATRTSILTNLVSRSVDSIDAFRTSRGTIPKSRLFVSVDPSSNVARLYAQKFTSTGAPSTARDAMSVITDTSRIEAEYGPAGLEMLEKFNQIQSMQRGNIILNGTETPFIEVYVKGMLNTMSGSDDALRGALLSPATALKSAQLGRALKQVDDADVGQAALDKLITRGVKSPSLYKGFGKFGRSPLWSRRADTKAKKAFSALFAVNRIVIGGPVRAAARGVRALAGDTGMIGRFADTIATSGFYSTIIGLFAWWGIRRIGAASTPGSEGPINTLLNSLNMLVPSGALNFGIANFVGALIAEATSAVISGEEESIQEFFKSLTETTGDPTIPASTISAALKDNFVKVEASYLLFPELSVTSPASTTMRYKFNSAVTATSDVVGSVYQAVQRWRGTAPLDNVEAKAKAATTQIYTVLQDPNMIKAGAVGNEAWLQLEQARKDVLETVLQQLVTNTTAPGSSKSSVAGPAQIMSKHYDPSGTAGTVNPLVDFGSFITSIAFGGEPDASDITELYRIYEGMSAGRAPMIKIGANATGDDKAKIESINKTLADLAKAYADLKKATYSANPSSEQQGSAGAAEPAQVAPTAP